MSTVAADRITDQELLKISAANPHLRFELVKGEITAMPPVGDHSGNLEGSYTGETYVWGKPKKARIYSSSAGFKLPNGNVRSPDVAVLLPEHPAYAKKSESFVTGAPDFLIEIRSSSDSLQNLKEKMREWMDNGCKLAFLIDPLEKKAHVYRQDGSVTEYPYTATLTGEDVLPGFSVCPAELDN